MDFADEVRRFVERIQNIRKNLISEEAVKQSLVLPLLQLLGYNVFDPGELIPEFMADPKNQIGIKKGEKVDYAVVSEGNPLFLIEVKGSDAQLDPHMSQVIRYFASTPAKFAIITNGIKYLFFTDINATNIMDSSPFLTINLEPDIRDSEIAELKKFHKSYYNANDIFSSATTMKYGSSIKQYLKEQLVNPGDDFARFVVKKVYDGFVTKAVITEFTPIMKRAFSQYVNEEVSDRLKTALNDAKGIENEGGEIKPLPKIETTDEEIESYHIIRSMLRKYVSADKIQYKDTQSYFAIQYEGHSWKWICRLSLGPNQKCVVFPDAVGENDRKKTIESIDKLYELEGLFKKALDSIISS